MSKRRYSENFYSEIDSLIKIHQEKSAKRFEMIEVAHSADAEEKNQSKYGYTPPPTFWEVASSNKLLKYALIFVGILFATLTISITLSGRMSQSSELAARDNGIVQHAESKEKTAKENVVDLTSAHETLSVSVKPVPDNWGEPQAGMLKPYKDDAVKLQEMNEKSFMPDISKEPVPPTPDTVKNNMTPGGISPSTTDTGAK